MACSSDKAGFAPALDAHHFYGQLSFSQHAFNLATAAPYDTAQLDVAALMQDGTPTPGMITYSSSDSTAVTVSSTGLLTALHATSAVVVRASLTYNGLTRADSAVVNVIDGGPPQHLMTLVLAPAAGDSAKVASQDAFFSPGSKSLDLVPTDSTGGTMLGLVVAVRSSDTLTATVVQSGNIAAVAAHRPGRVMLYASTYAYGVVKQDSLPFIVGWPLTGIVNTYTRTPTGTKNAILDFFSGTMTMGVGACLNWYSADTLRSVDLVFDDSANVAPPTGFCGLYGQEHGGAGNIPAYHADPTDLFSAFSGRSFPTAGVYHYHSTINGTSGTVIVCDERDRSCLP